MSEQNIEQRLADIEALLHQVVKGRMRTDLLFSELERYGHIPQGSNLLADKMIESYERRFQEEVMQERLSDSKIIPLAFGRRLTELRDEMMHKEQEILDLAVSFQRWGNMQQ